MQLSDLHPDKKGHFDYVGQFTTDIKHVAGKDNVVEDGVIQTVRVNTFSSDFASAREKCRTLTQLKEKSESLSFKLNLC